MGLQNGRNDSHAHTVQRATAKTLNQGVAEIDLVQVGLHNTYELNFFHAHFRHM